MCIILRLICEILSGIAVEIKLLWDSKHGVYGAASFIAIFTSWYLRKNMRKFTSVILYMHIICIAQWLFDAFFEILHYSDTFALHHKHWKPKCSFMQTGVDYFLQRKYDVISQLLWNTFYSWGSNFRCFRGWPCPRIYDPTNNEYYICTSNRYMYISEKKINTYMRLLSDKATTHLYIYL